MVKEWFIIDVVRLFDIRVSNREREKMDLKREIKRIWYCKNIKVVLVIILYIYSGCFRNNFKGVYRIVKYIRNGIWFWVVVKGMYIAICMDLIKSFEKGMK